MWKVQEQLQHLAPAPANAGLGVELLNFTVTTAPVVSARINCSESREKRGKRSSIATSAALRTLQALLHTGCVWNGRTHHLVQIK